MRNLLITEAYKLTVHECLFILNGLVNESPKIAAISILK